MKKSALRVFFSVLIVLSLMSAISLPAFAAETEPALEVGLDNVGELAVEQNPTLKTTIRATLYQSTFNETYLNAPQSIAEATGNTFHAAVGMLLSYYEMRQSREELSRAVEILEKKHVVSQVLCRLGGLSDLDLQSEKASLDSAKNNLSSLDNSISSLLGSVNLFLGREVSAPLTIKPFEPIDLSAVQTRDVEADLKLALSSSNALKMGRQTLSRLNSSKTAMDGSGNPFANTTSLEGAINSQNSANIQIEDNLKKSFRELDQSLSQQILALNTAELSLSFAEKTFRIDTIKYTIGMISSLEYLSAQASVSSSRNAYSKLQRTLYSDWERYKWYVNGVDIGARSAYPS